MQTTPRIYCVVKLVYRSFILTCCYPQPFFHLIANSIADDLVTDHEREFTLVPALFQGMYVGTTDTTVGDGDFDVVVLKGFRSEWGDLEVLERFGICQCCL